jgi:Tol biopolymer transport system component
MIHVVNPDSSEDRKIGGPLHITDVSPDGKKVLGYAWNQDRNVNELILANLDGTDPVVLTDGERGKFSGDGRKIAFLRNGQNGWFDIFMMNADGTDIVQITDTPDDENYVDVNHDGTEILFQASDDFGPYDAYRMNVDGSNRQKLNPSEDVLVLNPTFSPDGSKIAYEQYDSNTFESDIYVMNADGSERVNTPSGRLCTTSGLVL